MTANSTLYRFVTFKKDNKDDWKLSSINYSPRLSYGQKETNVSPTAKVGTYILNIDRSTNKLDIDCKLIFENDIIENESKEKFVVTRGNKDIRFSYINTLTGKVLDPESVDNIKWRVIGNTYLK